MYIGTYHKLKPIDDRVDRFTGNLMDTAILLEDAIKAVEDEPELPGQMPDEMWAMINGDRSIWWWEKQPIENSQDVSKFDITLNT